MTVDEHLIFYGELKGMTSNAIAAFTEVLTNSLDMLEHRHKLSKNLSGGNKRKLSMAISMMGKFFCSFLCVVVLVVLVNFLTSLFVCIFCCRCSICTDFR